MTQRDLDDTYSSLFTGLRLRVVCKCSEHFVALIEAYKKQRNAKHNNSEVIQKLEECLQTVQGIEQEVFVTNFIRKNFKIHRDCENWQKSKREAHLQHVIAFGVQ